MECFLESTKINVADGDSPKHENNFKTFEILHFNAV